MSDLMNAMVMLSKVFYKYSAKEGDKNKLNKSELKDLLTVEFGGAFTQNQKKDEVGDILKSLDADGDGEVDFQEYIVFVSVLAAIFNDSLPKTPPKK